MESSRSVTPQSCTASSTPGAILRPRSTDFQPGGISGQKSYCLGSRSSPEDTRLCDAKSKLLELLDIHADLSTWLHHTGYFNVNHRRSQLEYMRELDDLAAAKEIVLSRIRDSKPADASSTDAPYIFPIPLDLQGKKDTATVSSDRSSTSISQAPSTLTSRLQSTITLAPRLPVQDTRYFLVKSFNTTNVYMSREDSLWITQAKNGWPFTRAFRECKSVVLFFSVNKSRAFQGYAKMASLPDRNIPHPQWITATIQVYRTTPPFRIDWINESETPFRQVRHLRNPLNEYRPVCMGKDGQELSEDCGRSMMQVMDQTKAAEELGRSTIASHTTFAPAQPGRMQREFGPNRHFMTSNAETGAGGLRTSRWSRDDEFLHARQDSESTTEAQSEDLLDLSFR